MKKTVIRYTPYEKKNNSVKRKNLRMALLSAALIWFAVYSTVSGATVNQWVSEAARYLAETVGYHIAASTSYEIDISVDAGNIEDLTTGLSSENLIAVAVNTLGNSVRNLSHSLTFFILFFAVYGILKFKRKALAALIIATMCSVLSEYFQSFNDLRSASVIDSINNLIGVSGAFLVCLIIENIRRSIDKKNDMKKDSVRYFEG